MAQRGTVVQWYKAAQATQASGLELPHGASHMLNAHLLHTSCNKGSLHSTYLGRIFRAWRQDTFIRFRGRDEVLGSHLPTT
jgi:hypothetical protein